LALKCLPWYEGSRYTHNTTPLKSAFYLFMLCIVIVHYTLLYLYTLHYCMYLFFYIQFSAEKFFSIWISRAKLSQSFQPITQESNTDCFIRFKVILIRRSQIQQFQTFFARQPVNEYPKLLSLQT